MRKLILKFTFAFLLFLIALIKPTHAQEVFSACTISAPTEISAGREFNITVTNALDTREDFTVDINPKGGRESEVHHLSLDPGASRQIVVPSHLSATGIYTPDEIYIKVYLGSRVHGTPLCSQTVRIIPAGAPETEICQISAPAVFPNEEITVYLDNLLDEDATFWVYTIKGTQYIDIERSILVPANTGVTISSSASISREGRYQLVAIQDGNYTYNNRCTGVLVVTTDPEERGSTESAQQITLIRPKCCNVVTGQEAVCNSAPDRPGVEVHGIQTALGCFPTQPAAIIEWIINFAMMLAGGIGFLLMLYASFQIMTSGGDPEKLQEGKQLLGAAISGILLIVFSLFILRFIGATVLRIPGWQ